MALQKTISTRFGIDATYWKAYIENTTNTHVRYSLKGFSDQANSDAGGDPLDTYLFEAANSDLIVNERMPTMASIYEQAKLQEEMEGAKDVFE